MGPLLIDSNLLLLLVVGSASRTLIRAHKRLSGYGEKHFDLLTELTRRFSRTVTVPHVVAEVSSLSRQIANPAKAAIHRKLREFVDLATELPIPSAIGFRRPEAVSLGLTDAILLHLCETGITLMTADAALAASAESLRGRVVWFPTAAER